MKTVKKIKKLLKTRLSCLLPLVLIPEYCTDFYRYVRFSGMINRSGNREQLIGKIIQDYHVIEKGLTMPNARQGFGKERLLALVRNLIIHIDLFGMEDEQVVHGVGVVQEYWDKHEHMRSEFGEKIEVQINRLKEISAGVTKTEQREESAETYFELKSGDFLEFAKSRKSVRNYSGEMVPLTKLHKAIEIATHAPSSCNKQGTRVHVYSEREQIDKILSVQTGNRGFGHLANRILVVTGDLSSAHNVYERNQVFVDGGMFAMNLLYGLHSEGLVACPLNCYLPYSKERRLREFCELPDSEMLVVIISCGYAPEDFQVALSHRYPVSSIATFHGENGEILNSDNL